VGQETGNPDSISLQPSQAVSRLLQDGASRAAAGDYADAARSYAEAAAMASEGEDPAGFGRAMAQMAALEESCGEIEEAFAHNRQASGTFLAIGDGAGLVQTYRVDGFLHLRAGDPAAAANAFAKATALALQLDSRLALTTLNQVVPVARHLIESDQLPALLPLGVALTEAVESAAGARQAGMAVSASEDPPDWAWQQEMADIAELVATVGGVLAPLGVMAEEEALTKAQRRVLAARSTHQAWLVDALTRRRWALAVLVRETLQNKLDFHEELD
jgi:hypothetical protein